MEGDLDAAIKDKPQAGRPRALSATQAAHLIAIACSPAPDGHDHWTLRLLGHKAVELGYVEGISPKTIQQVLKKMSSSHGAMSNGVCLAWAEHLSRPWKTC